MVEEGVSEGPGVPHAPHGRGRNVKITSDPLLSQGQEPVLVCIESEVPCKQARKFWHLLAIQGMFFQCSPAKLENKLMSFGIS